MLKLPGRLAASAQRPDETVDGAAVLRGHRAQREVRHDRSRLQLGAVIQPLGFVHPRQAQAQVGRVGGAPRSLEAQSRTHQPFRLGNLALARAVIRGVAVVTARSADQVLTARQQLRVRGGAGGSGRRAGGAGGGARGGAGLGDGGRLLAATERQGGGEAAEEGVLVHVQLG